MFKEDRVNHMPMTESQVLSECSQLEVHAQEGNETKDSIEAMKCERAAPAFIKAIKEDADLWLLFQEHFHSEDVFSGLLDSKKFTSILAKVMKMMTDYYAVKDHNSKEAKMRQEVGLLEKHRAYLHSSQKRNEEDEEQERVQNERKRSTDKRSARGTDSHYPTGRSKERDTRTNFISPRQESSGYELIYSDGKELRSGHPKSQRHTTTSRRDLPTYDLDRIQKFAERAEKESKRRGDNRTEYEGQTGKYSVYGHRGASKSAYEANDDPMSQSFEEDQKIDRLDYRGSERIFFTKKGNQVPYEHSEPILHDAPRLSSPGKMGHPMGKLGAMREEMKKKKSTSPSPARSNGNRSDGEKRISFLDKMKDYDYASLLVNAKKPQEATFAQPQGPRAASQGSLNQFSDNDEMQETKKQQKKRDEMERFIKQISSAKSGSQGQQDTYPITQPINIVPLTPTETHGYRQRALQQDQNNKNSKIEDFGEGSSNKRSSFTAFGADSTSQNKKLTPLVPEKQKNDVYAKVDREREAQLEKYKSENAATKPAIKSKDRNHTTLESKASIDDVSRGFRSDSESVSRPPKGRYMPKLDNKNKGYKPASSREPKKYVLDAGIPDYKEIKSSNYGKITRIPGESRSKSGGRAKPANVKDIVDSILNESKFKAVDNSRIHDSRAADKSRLKESFNRSGDRSGGSLKSNSPGRSDFGSEPRDIYDHRKVDPLTMHQQKRHFPERDQFINTSGHII